MLILLKTNIVLFRFFLLNLSILNIDVRKRFTSYFVRQFERKKKQKLLTMNECLDAISSFVSFSFCQSVFFTLISTSLQCYLLAQLTVDPCVSLGDMIDNKFDIGQTKGRRLHFFFLLFSMSEPSTIWLFSSLINMLICISIYMSISICSRQQLMSSRKTMETFK